MKTWQATYRQSNQCVFNEKNFPSHHSHANASLKDVLFALSKFDSAIEELRQASQRPYASVPFNYEDGFNSVPSLLPILAQLKRCTQVLQLRTLWLNWSDGQSAKSVGRREAVAVFEQLLRNSPFLISQLVRIAIVAIDAANRFGKVWREHKWSDEQLAALEAELAKNGLSGGLRIHHACGERAFAIAWFENQRRTRELISPKATPMVMSLIV